MAMMERDFSFAHDTVFFSSRSYKLGAIVTVKRLRDDVIYLNEIPFEPLLILIT